MIKPDRRKPKGPALKLRHCPLGLATCQLAQLCKGECGILAGSVERAQRSTGANILAAGFLSGSEVCVLEVAKNGTWIVEANDNVYALSEQEASKLLVAKFSEAALIESASPG